MPNTPKRPDVEAIEARAIALKGTLRDDPKMELRVDQLLFYNIPALIAYIKALEAHKWDVQHTDTMNDMVALGIDRDSWKARVEALEARQVKLEMFVRMAREQGQLENAIAYLDEGGAALGDGDE